MSATQENKRTNYSKPTKRTKPSGVRFNIQDFKTLLNEFGVKTAQQVVDRFVDDWKIAKIVGNPVMERNLVPPPSQTPETGHREAKKLKGRNCRQKKEDVKDAPENESQDQSGADLYRQKRLNAKNGIK